MGATFKPDVLDGRVALVTGASRGIGAAIAAALAEAGARVVGTATSDGGAEGISAALGERGRGAVLDITSDASVKALFDDLQKTEGVHRRQQRRHHPRQSAYADERSGTT